MTTLAEVNATLGATNVVLSSVAEEQKETNKGISKFVEFMQDKDTRDRRESIEDKRERKASVISSVGSGAAAAGGAIASVGKKGFGLTKDLFGKLGGIIPIGLAGAFLTSLVGSKLFRGGIAGLGFMFGDQIAEMLTGPDAKKEVKDMLGGAIKGGALGFLLGPRFALIGTILGGLLSNKEIDEQAGRLVTNLKNLQVKFPALGKFFMGVTSAIGGGLESINKLLEGTSENKIADIAKSIALIGGVAALLMPGKILGLLAMATRLLVASPAGLALLAIGGGGLLANKLMGNNVTEGEVDPTAFGTGALITGAGIYGGKKVLNKMTGKSGGKAPDIDPSSKGLKGKGGIEGKIDKNLVASLRKYPRLAKFLKFAGRFGGLGTLIGVGELFNMARTGNLTVEAVSGLFGGILGGVGGTKLGAAIGTMFGPGPGTILGGILGGGLGYIAGDTIAKALGQWMLGKKVDAFGFGFGRLNDLLNGTDGAAPTRTASMATDGTATSSVTKSPAISGVRNQFEANRNVSGITANTMDPTGNTGSVNMINSNNTTTNVNNASALAIGSSGAFDIRDNLGKQIQGFGT